MNEISPTSNNHAALAKIAARRAHQQPAEQAETQRGGDRVEVSQAARLLAKLQEMPEVRQDVVDRVRDQIRNGTFETNQRLDGAAAELLNDLT